MKKFVYILFFITLTNVSMAGWTVVNTGTTYNFTDIQLRTSQLFYATAFNPTTYAGVLFKSTDGGVSWQQFPLPPYCNYPTSCNMSSDGLHGIVAGTALILTSDGGTNWFSAYTPPDTVIFFDVDEGSGAVWAVGDRANGNNIIAPVIVRCSNINAPNAVFTRMSLPSNMSTYQLTSVEAVDSMTCYIGVNGHPIFDGVLKTTNKGANWIQVSTNMELWTVSVSRDNGMGFATGGGNSNNAIFQTTNYGQSWNPVFTGNSGALKGLFRGAYVYAVGENGFIVKGNYFGEMWTQQYSPVSTDLNAVGAVDNNTDIAYIVGDNGMMLKTNDGGIGVQIISTEIPASYSLSQNYPNPFNPSTNIKFELPKSAFTTLIVYDALGRELETIVNEHLSAGIYEASWRADKYSTGVYYYRLIAGDYSDSKKMIVAK